MRRSDPPANPKSSITTTILRHMHRSLDFVTAHDCVLWGTTVVGFFFLLRRSEYLANGTRTQPYAIQRRDVTFLSAKDKPCYALNQTVKIAIHFRGGKSDQFGEGNIRVLARTGLHWCCPLSQIGSMWSTTWPPRLRQTRSSARSTRPPTYKHETWCKRLRMRPVSPEKIQTGTARTHSEAAEHPHYSIPASTA